MDEKQFERLLVVIVYMSIGTILAIRGVGEAVTDDHVWRAIYNVASMVSWVYATLRGIYG